MHTRGLACIIVIAGWLGGGLYASPSFPGGDFTTFAADSEHEIAQAGTLSRTWDGNVLRHVFRIYDKDFVRVLPGTDPEGGDQIRLFFDLRPPALRGRYPYSEGVWHLAFRPSADSNEVESSSFGAGSVLSSAGLKQIAAKAAVLEGGWSVAIEVPWQVLKHDPTTLGDLGASFQVWDQTGDSEGARVASGAKALGETVRPETDPILFDTLDLEQAGGIDGLELVAEETVLNGDVCTHLRVVRAAEDQRFTDTAVKIEGVAGLDQLVLRPSAGERFMVGEIYHPAPALEPGSETTTVRFSGVNEEWSRTFQMRRPIAVAREKIERLLPEDELAAVPEERRRSLARFLKQMAMEVADQLTLEPLPTRARQRQLRGRGNPQFYDGAVDYFVGWGRRVLTRGEPEGLLNRCHVWRSELDDSLQLLRVDFPVGFKRGGDFPVTFNFHGLLDDPLRYRQVFDLLLKEDEGRAAAAVGESVLIHLRGRGNQMQPLGDEEFDAAWNLARSLVKRADPLLTIRGGSGGATDGMVFALRHPEKVVQVDLRSGSYLPKMEQVERLIPSEIPLLERLYGFSGQMERLRFANGRLAAGDRDYYSVQQMQTVGGWLQAVGAKIDLSVIPQGSHGTVADMMAIAVPDAASGGPRSVNLRNGTPAYARMDGLSVQGWERFGEEWSVQARLSGSRRQLTLLSKNVNRVILEKGALGLSPLTDSLTIDGATFPRSVFSAGPRLLLQRTGGGWEQVGAFAPGAMKRPEAGGPMLDVRRRRFLIVKGTRDPASREAIQARAYKIARELTDPVLGSGIRLTIRNDSEVTDGELRQNSLWLIGGPADNSAYARLDFSPPFSVSADAIEFGGKVRGAGAAMYINLIRPHPTADGQYVYMEAATRAAGYFAPVMPNNAFDYSIVQMDLLENPLLTRGFFDQAWAHDPKLEFRHD